MVVRLNFLFLFVYLLAYKNNDFWRFPCTSVCVCVCVCVWGHVYVVYDYINYL